MFSPLAAMAASQLSLDRNGPARARERGPRNLLVVGEPAISSVTVDALLPRLDQDRRLFLLDVREPDEFAAWHIPGAVNIPIGELGRRRGEIAPGRHVVAVCAVGTRATQGAIELAADGIPAGVLRGGMEAWGHAYEAVDVDLAGATVVQVRRRGKGCLSYVIGADETCVVIDPSSDVERYLEIARRHGFSITHVFDTHLHADHLSGARDLAARSAAELVLNPADPFTYDFTAITDGLRVPIGRRLHLEVAAVAAPGHTEGSTVYRLGDAAVFTGDTLFLESVGRPDLADQAESYAHLLYRSLHEIVLPLRDDILVLPAHYGESVPVRYGELVTRRLGELRASLPALALDEAAFVDWAVAHVTDRPPNYREIVRYNAGTSERSKGELAALELGPNNCAVAS
jgi:glyoxylase-like metal-dependent hydrolase (beta-lactamase superfamily II)